MTTQPASETRTKSGIRLFAAVMGRGLLTVGALGISVGLVAIYGPEIPTAVGLTAILDGVLALIGVAIFVAMVANIGIAVLAMEDIQR